MSVNPRSNTRPAIPVANDCASCRRHYSYLTEFTACLPTTVKILTKNPSGDPYANCLARGRV